MLQQRLRRWISGRSAWVAAPHLHCPPLRRHPQRRRSARALGSARPVSQQHHRPLVSGAGRRIALQPWHGIQLRLDRMFASCRSRQQPAVRRLRCGCGAVSACLWRRWRLRPTCCSGSTGTGAQLVRCEPRVRSCSHADVAVRPACCHRWVRQPSYAWRDWRIWQRGRVWAGGRDGWSRLRAGSKARVWPAARGRRVRSGAIRVSGVAQFATTVAW